MPTLQWTLDVKEDGQTLPGFPLTKTVVTTESLGRNVVNRTSGAGFFELPLGDLDTVTILFVQADQDLVIRFNDQSDAGLPITANGFIALVDVAIPSGATSKASIENTSGSTAEVKQIAAGS